MDHPFGIIPPATLQTGLVPGTTGVAPVAPPELVSRFESMMQRLQEAGNIQPPHSQVPPGVVAKIDDLMKEPTELLSRMSATDMSGMTLAEISAFQIQTISQASAISMKEEACFAVVSTAKKSVSDLMKNQ